MTRSLPATTHALLVVRERLRRAALAARVPPRDVDDVVDGALWKASRERIRKGAPGFTVRVRTALHDEIVDYFRRAAARPDVDFDADLPEHHQSPLGQRRVEFQEFVAYLRTQLDDDELEYVLLTNAGWTEAQIALREGWSIIKTGRVRKRLERKRSRLGAALSDLGFAVQPQQQKEAS